MTTETQASPQPATNQHRDPVCGMSVDEHMAQKGVFEGTTYFFCSNHCRKTFDRDPKKYTQPQ
ncbi:MAG: YHS domain-containing protein [Myxococcota bacterium]